MPINSRNVFMDSIKRRTLNRKNPNPGFPKQNTQPVAPPQAPNAEPALREDKIAPIGRAYSKQPEINHQIGETNDARNAANNMQEAIAKRNEWDITDRSARQIFGNEQKKVPTENVPEANDVVDMQKRKSTQPVKPTTSAAKSATKSSAMRKRTAII